MTLQIPANAAQCAIRLNSTATVDPWYVTFGVDSAPSSTAAETVRSAFTTNVMPQMSNTITAEAMRMWDESIVFEVSFSVAGGVAAQQLPPNCAVLVKKNTGLVGRRHQGRMFLPGMEAASDPDVGGAITSGRAATIQTAVNAFWTALNTAGHQMVILHNTPGSPVPTLVESLTVQRQLATQRRRMR